MQIEWSVKLSKKLSGIEPDIISMNLKFDTRHALHHVQNNYIIYRLFVILRYHKCMTTRYNRDKFFYVILYRGWNSSKLYWFYFREKYARIMQMEWRHRLLTYVFVYCTAIYIIVGLLYCYYIACLIDWLARLSLWFRLWCVFMSLK